MKYFFAANIAQRYEKNGNYGNIFEGENGELFTQLIHQKRRKIRQSR